MYARQCSKLFFLNYGAHCTKYMCIKDSLESNNKMISHAAAKNIINPVFADPCVPLTSVTTPPVTLEISTVLNFGLIIPLYFLILFLTYVYNHQVCCLILVVF